MNTNIPKINTSFKNKLNFSDSDDENFLSSSNSKRYLENSNIDCRKMKKLNGAAVYSSSDEEDDHFFASVDFSSAIDTCQANRTVGVNQSTPSSAIKFESSNFNENDLTFLADALTKDEYKFLLDQRKQEIKDALAVAESRLANAPVFQMEKKLKNIFYYIPNDSSIVIANVSKKIGAGAENSMHYAYFFNKVDNHWLLDRTKYKLARPVGLMITNPKTWPQAPEALKTIRQMTDIQKSIVDAPLFQHSWNAADLKLSSDLRLRKDKKIQVSVERFYPGTGLDPKYLDSRPKVIERILTVAKVLKRLNDAGIMHGDCRPDNILVDESGNTIVADFGRAIYESKITRDRNPGEVGGEDVKSIADEKRTFGYFIKETIKISKSEHKELHQIADKILKKNPGWDYVIDEVNKLT